MSHVSGRNSTPDGYNLGLKYQCVEFVKRYYYQHLKHKMPDSYGHAKDFFDKKLKDGQRNKRRNLIQYTNKSKSKPEKNDLIVFDGHKLNKFGHVAIISEVYSDGIEIIQQNQGMFSKSRIHISITLTNGKWQIQKERTLGWLRKKNKLLILTIQ